MELMQRLGSHVNDEYIKGYLSAATKYKGACDNVWIATLYGFPPPEAHREAARVSAGIAREFRKRGISVSLQLSNTVGHGQYMCARDCSGLHFPDSPVRRMVGHDGKVADYAYCWNDSYFRGYIYDTLVPYLEQIQPDVVWVDDDLRAHNHAPVAYGCFCEECIRGFNAKYGSALDREALVREILHGDPVWRKRYVDFMREGIYSFVYELSALVHRICPSARMGLQYYRNGAYTGHGYAHILDAMQDATGYAPHTRPGGGAYIDHDPNTFILKGIDISYLNSLLPDYSARKCAEIEALPFVAFGKSQEAIALEASYYFAVGSTDMTFSMLMNQNEPWEFYEKTFSLFAENRTYWDRLSACNSASVQSGIEYFISDNAWAKEIGEGEGFDRMNREYADTLMPFTHSAIPFAFDRGGCRVKLLHPEIARIASDREIKALLGECVVTDGETAAILEARGFDLGLHACRISDFEGLKLFERLEAHPSNRGGLDEWRSSFFMPGKSDSYYFASLPQGAELLGRYVPSAETAPLMEDGSYGISSAIITTSLGGRWAVLGYAPWKGVVSLARRDQLLNVIDYLSGDALPARLLTPVQAMLLPRTDAKGRTVCVSVLNCTVGESGELRFLVRLPRAEHFTWMAQRGVRCELPFERVGDGYLVTAPSLSAWSVGTLFCEEE